MTEIILIATVLVGMALVAVGLTALDEPHVTVMSGVVAGAAGLAVYLAVVWSDHPAGVLASAIRSGGLLAALAVTFTALSYTAIGRLFSRTKLGGAIALAASLPVVFFGGIFVLLAVSIHVGCPSDGADCL